MQLKNQFITYLTGICCCIFLISCSESRMDLLIAHPWKMHSSSINGVTDTIDYTNYRLTFKDNGDFEEIQADSSVVTGDWYINRDRTIVTLKDPNGVLTDMTIYSLKTNEFTFTINTGNVYRRTLVSV